MKTGYVVLNYETYWETLECVQSILDRYRGDPGEDRIVIVDNGSKNDSLERLRERFRNNGSVRILANETNLGFAKGNNVGFRVCKYDLNCDFIVMMNSDIIVQEELFTEKMIDAYRELGYAVAGPNVVSPDGTRLNPVYSGLVTVEDIDRRIAETKRRIRLCETGLDPLASAVQRIGNRGKGKREQRLRETASGTVDMNAGVQLQGCFFVFSPIYVKVFDGLYDRTFLYGEETLLRLRCIRAGMEMACLNGITVLHKESRTVRHLGGNLKERHLRRFRYTLDSLEIIREYMENETRL